MMGVDSLGPSDYLATRARLAREVHTLAVDHIDLCNAALKAGGKPPTKTTEPYCGCTACMVREVLAVSWTHLVYLTDGTV